MSLEHSLLQYLHYRCRCRQKFCFSVYMVKQHLQSSDQQSSETNTITLSFLCTSNLSFLDRLRYGHNPKTSESFGSKYNLKDQEKHYGFFLRWHLKCFDAFQPPNCYQIMRRNGILQNYKTVPRPIVQNSWYGTSMQWCFCPGCQIIPVFFSFFSIRISLFEGKSIELLPKVNCFKSAAIAADMRQYIYIFIFKFTYIPVR